MVTSLARQLHLTTSGGVATSVAYSQPVSLDGVARYQVEARVLQVEDGPGVLQVHIEQSNDLVNWSEPEPLSYISLSDIGQGVLGMAALGYASLRLRFVAQLSGDTDVSFIVAASIATDRAEGEEAMSTGPAGPGVRPGVAPAPARQAVSLPSGFGPGARLAVPRAGGVGVTRRFGPGGNAGTADTVTLRLIALLEEGLRRPAPPVYPPAFGFPIPAARPR